MHTPSVYLRSTVADIALMSPADPGLVMIDENNIHYVARGLNYVAVSGAGGVVDTLTGNQSDRAPSVRAVKAAGFVTQSGLTDSIRTALGSIDLLPQPVADSASGTEDTALSGNVLTNDTNLTGTKVVLSYKVISNGAPSGTTYTAGVSSSSNPVGAFILRSDGSWNLTPRLNVYGALPPITYVVSNGLGERTGTLNIVLAGVNDAPIAGNDSVETAPDTAVSISVLGNDTDPDGNALTVTHINGVAVTVGGSSVAVPHGSAVLYAPGIIRVTPNTGYTGNIEFPYSITDGVIPDDGSVLVWVHTLTVGNGTSNYKTAQTAIAPVDWVSVLPPKRGTYVEPTTGATVRRMTDVTLDYPGQTGLFQAYSRFPCENATGEMILAFAGNSFNTAVIERGTGNVVAHLLLDSSGLESHGIGTFHEVRWHYGTDHPYRVYFVNNQQFWMIDDVRDQNGTRVLIKDFSTVIDWAGVGTESTRRIMNDQEGNSSLDSDHWAWMATDGYSGSAPVRCYIHYQVSTDTVHTMYPADLSEFPRAPIGEAIRSTFRFRPNTIEPTPDGSGILIHHGRSGPGYQDAYGGTCFEAPYIWPLNFTGGGPGSFTPFRIAADAAHSGWSIKDGIWYHCFGDNVRDFYCAAPISGPHKGYGADGVWHPETALNTAGIIDIYHDVNPYPGQHMGVCTADGWLMVSTYIGTDPSVNWVANALWMWEIKQYVKDGSGTILPEGPGAPICWHVAPTFGLLPGAEKQDYNESPASINLSATRIMTCGDWVGTAPQVGGGLARYTDMYEVALPTGWPSHFVPTVPANVTAPSVSGTPTQGQTLTATLGIWTGFPNPTLTGIWQRDMVDIAGATGLTRVAAALDAGHKLRYKVTGTNASGTVVAYSAETATIADLAIPVNTAAPVLSGSPQEGANATITPGTWTNSPTSVTYDLYLDNVLTTTGLGSLTFPWLHAHVGKVPKIRESASNGVGDGTPVFSNTLAAITEDPGSIVRASSVKATGPTGWNYTDLPSFNAVAGGLIVVNALWNDTANDGASTLTVTDTAGNTYTAGPQVSDGNIYGVKVQQFYCLSSSAQTGNVVRLTQTVTVGGADHRESPVNGHAVQYTSAEGTTWSRSGSFVTKSVGYSLSPVVTDPFNTPAESVCVAAINETYAIGTIDGYGDTVVDTWGNSWTLERRSASGATGKTVSGNSGNTYSRFGVSVAVFQRT